MTPTEKYSRLLDSLKVAKEGPEEMHGWRFDEPFEIISKKLNDFWVQCLCDNTNIDSDKAAIYIWEYFQERCRRAETNAKTETLLEEVKEAVRDAMDVSEAYQKACSGGMTEDQMTLVKSRDEFIKLSEASK